MIWLVSASPVKEKIESKLENRMNIHTQDIGINSSMIDTSLVEALHEFIYDSFPGNTKCKW